MTTRRYARMSGVLWRAASDRVLLRRVCDYSPDSAADLTGSAALLWVALDEPLSASELRSELAIAGYADVIAECDLAISMLLDHRLIAEVD